MILSSFAEIISLSLLMPFLVLLTSPEAINNYDFVNYLDSILNINNLENLLKFLAILFIISSLLSAFIRILNLFYIQKLAASIGNYFAYESFKRTIYQEYSFYLNSNSSKTISGITLQISRTVLIINQVLLFFTSFFISLGILISLLILNTKITIITFLFFSILYLFIALITKNKLLKLSKNITRSTDSQVKYLQEGLGSIKEMLLSSNYNYFLSNFDCADKKMRFSLAESRVISTFPKFAIESFGIIFIVLLSILMSNKASIIIPFLGTFAFAAQKLIPSINQIYTSWANLFAYSSSLKNVLNMLERPIDFEKFNRKVDFSLFNQSIVLKNVGFRYKYEKNNILNDINLKINKGDRIGIIGKTGSGKSTLMDILMGLLKPTIGNIYVDGNNTKNDISVLDWRSLVAHVPQSIFLSDASFIENIAYGIDTSKVDLERVKFVARQACLLEFIESTKNGFKTKIGERGVKLSGGQKQRIGIARALYRKSKIIFLDEATSALDKNTEKGLLKTIDDLEDNLTIVMIAHRYSSLIGCNKVFEVKDGSIYKVNLKI